MTPAERFIIYFTLHVLYLFVCLYSVDFFLVYVEKPLLYSCASVIFIQIGYEYIECNLTSKSDNVFLKTNSNWNTSICN